MPAAEDPGFHRSHILAHRAVLRRAERNDTIHHLGPPEAYGQHIPPGLVRVVEAVKHDAEVDLPAACIVTALLFLVKVAWFNIPLTFTRSQEDISASAALHHSPGNVVMLVLILTIRDQIRLGPMGVCDEMGAHQVDGIGQIGVYRECVLWLFIADRADVLRFHTDGIHHTDFVDQIANAGLPVYTLRDTFERLIRWDGIAELLAAHPRNGIGEQGVFAIYPEFNLVADLAGGQNNHLFHYSLSVKRKMWYTKHVMHGSLVCMWIEKP